ncbi:M81 family metallopeptidase (plasmid) [Halorussus salilacus]|uniref:M81 family metallopeptidase n=1 Tax=Halorussus salilacus TaxID=2953750 RepID=UPI00209FF954|nr:M81 family metallopeptidase [Halorussus salilacus]USZ69907.1 M81 family metallopeptidase [Halorussus salilacus]
MTDETVLVGEFSHETNTFAVRATDRAAFADRREYVGEELVAGLRGTNTPVGGILDAAESAGLDLVPSVAAAATPGGLVTEDAYDFYAGEILSAVRERGDDLDGVALSLHGAMVPEGRTDGEGPLLSAVREAVGPDVPVVATLDLHGNVTDEMCAAADALVAFETYPHVDMAETGRRATRLLVEMLREGREYSMHVERPPMLPLGPLQNTRGGPMADIMATARRIEDRDGVAKVNVLPGFHKADVPAMGTSVVAVADDESAGVHAARDLAAELWEMREAFVGEFPDPMDAVGRALRAADANPPEAGPVVLADSGDNPGGGGTGDETAVLRELIDRGATNAGLALVHDPEAVAACVEAGVGERVTVTLGGKAEGSFTPPICEADGYVAAITDGEFRNAGPMATGTENHLGRTVLFRCGEGDGVRVILTEKRIQPLDAEIWRHVGVQPERLDVVAVKSNNHYRAAYEPMASEVITVNSPGVAAFDPNQYDYDRIRRPRFPVDEMAADDYPDWY